MLFQRVIQSFVGRQLLVTAQLVSVHQQNHLDEHKITKCCTEVSITNVTAPILGYRIQKKRPPCVLAVIFETTEGEVCSHWRQTWVIGKIRDKTFIIVLKKINHRDIDITL
uniref:Chemokine interleukin-8-like domain-containing protein n=1 Tax=Neogobius melanostomus TaxID=47308 RepID=A0A8C6TF64_9GOBI